MKVVSMVLLSALLATAPAWAVLGERLPSVQSDLARMHGELRAKSYQGYSVQQITAPDGTVVKEYVSPYGIVFGVSWQAAAMPDLSQLLGSYFPEFQKASRSPVRRRAFTVKSNQLVVESGGHLRSFHGRAYVPSLVPSDLSPAVIQ
jgi:Protein of unknown function (DUF2844)